MCEQFGIYVDRPLMCQVSRFDPWKDPLGVIDAYRIVQAALPEVQLALVGSMASDDPEGWEFFNATIAHANGDPDIHILNNFNNVGAIEVNAFQSHPDVLPREVQMPALWPDGVRGGMEGAAVHRRQRRRDTAADRRWRHRLSRVERRAVRRARACSAARPRARQGARQARQGARAQALPDAALPAGLSADSQRAAGARRATHRSTADDRDAGRAIPAGAGVKPRAGHVSRWRRGPAGLGRARHRADWTRLSPRSRCGSPRR